MVKSSDGRGHASRLCEIGGQLSDVEPRKIRTIKSRSSNKRPLFDLLSAQVLQSILAAWLT